MRATHNGNEFTDRWNSETREIFTIFSSPASATLLAANKPLIHFPETRNNFRLFSRKYCRYDRNETLILSFYRNKNCNIRSSLIGSMNGEHGWIRSCFNSRHAKISEFFFPFFIGQGLFKGKDVPLEKKENEKRTYAAREKRKREINNKRVLNAWDDDQNHSQFS